MGTRRLAVAGATFTLIACAPHVAPEVPDGLGETSMPAGDGEVLPEEDTATATAATAVSSQIRHELVRATTDLTATPLEAGTYRIHLIDVGTGLAVLIQGSDFNFLFDGGSGDDSRGISASDNNSRLLAYLWAALGPSGPRGCQPGRVAEDLADDPEVTIATVVLSHPHADHGAMLDEVLRCFHVENVYDSGAVNDAAFYGAFIAAVASEPGVTYHTATAPPASATVTVSGTTHTIAGDWVQFSESSSESDRIDLGDGASLRILHANGDTHADFNENSIVLRVDLGGTSILLTGDAESGPRLPPSGALGDIEQHLVETHPDAIDVDILQVGHHGSETSSRQAFLDVVSPNWALIGAGPKKYGSVVLPDATVVSAVTTVVGDAGRVLRTDDNDGVGCPVPDRIGTDDDRPGGCDNHILEVSGGCCRTCTTGRACGNSCISADATCNHPPGCACEGP